MIPFPFPKHDPVLLSAFVYYHDIPSIRLYDCFRSTMIAWKCVAEYEPYESGDRVLNSHPI